MESKFDQEKKWWKIISYYQFCKNGYISFRGISDIVSCSPSTVFTVFKKFEIHGRVFVEKRIGRPNVISEKQGRVLINDIKKNPKVILSELKSQNNINASISTISNFLVNKGLKSQYVKKKFFLPKSAQKLRVEFAKKYMEKPKKFFGAILWTDETHFVYMGSSGKVRVRKFAGQDLDYEELDQARKHGKFSLSIWGCVCAQGVRAIKFYKGRLNADKYKQILIHEGIPCYKKNSGMYGRFFQQDNAPCHKANKILNYFESKNVNVISWPPYSPDISPIENIWGIIKNKISTFENEIMNIEEYEEIIQSILYNIPNSTIKNTFYSVKKRLQTLYKNNGKCLIID